MNCWTLLTECSCVCLSHLPFPGFPRNAVQKNTGACSGHHSSLLPATQVSVLCSFTDGTDSLGGTASEIQMSAQACQASPRQDSAMSSVLTTARTSHICAPHPLFSTLVLQHSVASEALSWSWFLKLVYYFRGPEPPPSFLPGAPSLGFSCFVFSIPTVSYPLF